MSTVRTDSTGVNQASTATTVSTPTPSTLHSRTCRSPPTRSGRSLSAISSHHARRSSADRIAGQRPYCGRARRPSRIWLPSIVTSPAPMVITTSPGSVNPATWRPTLDISGW